MLYPMFAMVVLVFLLGVIAVKVRFASVKSGEVNRKYFRLMQGYEPSEIVQKTTRSFNNQFEIPLLFYVVCTLYISLGIESQLSLIVAWLFVILRYIHAYVHLSYNNVFHRMGVYWLAFICVMVLWINLLVSL